jgi:hypothetical protein
MERVYCAVRSKFLNILIHVQFRLHVKFRRFVGSLTQQKLGFDPGPVYVRYVMHKGARGQVFSKHFIFPLLLSFHKWSIPFIYILLLQDRLMDEAWEPYFFLFLFWLEVEEHG